MAFLAASLVAEVVGMLLIVSTPVFLADSTSALLVAASILPLAVLTSSETCFFKSAFSSAVKFEASIASFLALAA